jgi:hypothetical protein
MRVPALIAAFALTLPVCAGETPDPAGQSAWHEPVRVATGSAHEGPWRMNESDFRYVDDPAVALYPNGDVGVAWVDQAEQNVFFQRYTNGEAVLEEPANVSKSPKIFSWLPRLVISGETVYALWQEIVFSGGTHGGEAFFARSTDGGKNFEAPQNLSNTTNGVGKGRLTERSWHNGSLDLAAAGGTLYAAWTAYQGPLHLSRSVDGGESWSEPMLVAGGEDELPARGPSLAVGPDGRVHLAWAVGEHAAADIRHATSTDRGETFSKPQRVHVSRAHDDAPKVAVHDDGTVHLAWMASTGGPFRDYRVLYARKTDEAESFTDPETLSLPLPEGFTSAGFPHLVLDANSDPVILFELFEHRAQRGTGLALVRSGNGGKTFTEPQMVPRGGEQAAGVNGSRQGLFMDKLAVTAAGNIVVVNATFDEDVASHVWLMQSK